MQMTESDIEFAGAADAKPTISEVIAALKRDSTRDAAAVSPVIVYGLSELADDDISVVEATWRGLPASYKSQVLRQLNESSEVSFELNFRELAMLSLRDTSEKVRAVATDMLWIDESLDTMRCLIALAADDPSDEVRARALAALGRYILLGEYGEIPARDAQEAQELALRLHNDATETVEVRRRALEALANANHPQVESLIQAAYADGNHLLNVSAVFAMGRTCDAKWQHILLAELGSDDSELVYEAIQACGHIQVEDSLRKIGELTLSEDREIQMMAIWAIGEIGGRRAIEILSSLSDATDDETLLESIDEALDAASFKLSMPALDFKIDDR